MAVNHLNVELVARRNVKAKCDTVADDTGELASMRYLAPLFRSLASRQSSFAWRALIGHSSLSQTNLSSGCRSALRARSSSCRLALSPVWSSAWASTGSWTILNSQRDRRKQLRLPRPLGITVGPRAPRVATMVSDIGGRGRTSACSGARAAGLCLLPLSPSRAPADASRSVAIAVAAVRMARFSRRVG